jgi:hypothetical protein
MAYDFPNAPSVGTIFAPPGGPIWQWTGTVWAISSPAGIPEAPTDGLLYGRQNGLWANILNNIVQTIISTPGAGVYSKPAGLKFLDVILIGGGGGSSRGGISAAGTASAGGGGGGAGVCFKLYKASDLAATEAYVIGAGGTSPGGTGGDGGASTFKGLTAGGGGGGGALMTATAALGTGSTRGAGASATGGDLNLDGQHGGQGWANPHGRVATAIGGFGGSNCLAQGLTPGLTATLLSGGDGRFPGAGAYGGAGAGTGGATAGTGGIGGNGGLILKEYY